MAMPTALPPNEDAPWSTTLWDSATRLANAVGARAEGDARWRRALISDMDPRDCDVILDARCGNGALVIGLAKAAPKAVILGLDPRDDALARARDRADAAGVKLNLIHGAAEDIASYVNELRPTRIVCALTAADDHAARRAILAAAHAALAPRGTLHLVEPAGPTPSVLDQVLKSPPAKPRQNTHHQSLIDMMRQSGFIGVMDLGVFTGQTAQVRLFRGAAP
jgi:SAM-dependent methyltransferase